ncbi:MAG TPA: MobH family relaxase [Burkholderiaceae bacterium]|nr:MobH family relaxase [Burkholderiaceae bacterium]
MRSFLSSLFGNRPVGPSGRAATPSAAVAPRNTHGTASGLARPTPSTSSAPVAGAALELRPVEDLLAEHGVLLDRVRLAYGSGAQAFEQDLLEPIRNYARLVNTLPATAANVFNEPGGLLRLGLEIGFIALQGSDGRIIEGRSTISVRSRLEPRWRQAVFIAGLCAEAHRVFERMQVRSDTGHAWPPYLVTLTDWACERGERRAHLLWEDRSRATRALNLFAVRHVIPPLLMQHLDEDNRIIVPQLLASLSDVPLYHGENAMEDLVLRASAHVIYRDVLKRTQATGVRIVGEHLQRFLINAMRQLITEDPKWSPNQHQSRVWLATDGLFVVWPNAAPEIAGQLSAEQLPGVPTDPDVIVDVLSAASILQQAPDGEWLWNIRPPPGSKTLTALRFTDPRVLLPMSLDVKQIDDRIVVAGRPRASDAPVQADTDAPTTTAAPASPSPTPGTTPADATAAAAGDRPRSTPPTARPEPAQAPARPATPASSPLGVSSPPPAAVAEPDEDLPDASRQGSACTPKAEPPASEEALNRKRGRAPEAPKPIPRLPLRLDPAVRRAMTAALEPHADSASKAVLLDDQRWFFPMSAFESCDITRAELMRVLDAAGLRTPDAELSEYVVTGENLTGVVLRLTLPQSRS